MNRSWMLGLGAAFFVLHGSQAWAQVTVKDAWVRATVVQQKATGAFMQLQAVQDSQLVAAQSPLAGVVEVHEMAMDNGVMKMRALPQLPLPAGKTVELKPGGYHVMLMDLKSQVKEGDNVPLTLVVQGPEGKRQRIEVNAKARQLATPNAMPHGHEGHNGHKH